jgi:tetratricopeptide (TPR) repeat protein
MGQRPSSAYVCAMHLRPQDLRDAAAGRASPEASAHLSGCARCRVELRLFTTPNGATFSWSGESAEDQTGATRLGPYVVDQVLGVGGMGVVYLAHHGVTGGCVALKTVRLPDPRLTSTLRREIAALNRVRHPSVVRVVEWGLQDGLPWYAMEWVQGVLLAEWPRSGALEVLARVCRALGFVHAQGVVHRDIKPANILVRADGQPVLLDFGLVSQTAVGGKREQLDLEMLGGTPAFMAPEQAARGQVDARADLYALGCLLYELLAGRLPFQGSPSSLVRAHLTQTPTPPSQHASVAAELERITMACLEKNPQARLGYAVDLARAIEVHLGLPAGPDPPDYVYRPRFVGRADELLALAELRDAGHLALIGGPSGVGKTRLAMAFAHQTQALGSRVLVSSCDAEGSPPLSGFRGLLLRLADTSRDAPEAHLLEIAGVLAPYEPALASLPALGGLQSRPELRPAAARKRLFRALSSAIEHVSSQGPLVLLIDDLQWADELTLAFLGEQYRTGGLAVVATHRTDQPSGAVTALAGLACCGEVRVGPLDDGHIAAVVGDMLALQDPEDPLVLGVCAKADGHPFFAAEYVRAAVAEALLKRDTEGRWRVHDAGGVSQLPLPDALRPLVQRRLEPVRGDADPWLVLVAASALSRSASPGLLGAVAGLEPERMDAALLRLLALDVLSENDSGRLGTAHDAIREVVWEGVSVGERRAMHDATASALLARRLQGGWDEVARHLSGAERADEAADAYLQAGRDAVAATAFDAAERHLRAGLELAAEGSAASIELLLMLGFEVLEITGRPREAADMLARAARESAACGDIRSRAKALTWLAMVRADLGRTDAAHSAALAALQGADAVGGDALQGRARHALAYVLLSEGRLPEAQPVLERTILLLERAGEARVLGSALNNLATVLRETGSLARAKAMDHRALSVLEALGDAWGMATSLANLSIYRSMDADFEGAVSTSQRALELHIQAGNARLAAVTLGNIAFVMTPLDPAAACERAEEALRQATAIGDLAVVAFAASTLAVARLATGDGQGAWDVMSPVLDEAPTHMTATGVHLAAARVQRLWFDQPERAVWHAQEARDLATRQNNLAAVVSATVELGHAALAAGREAGPWLAELVQHHGREGQGATTAAIDRLRAAAESDVLCRGELPSELPEGLRRAVC